MKNILALFMVTSATIMFFALLYYGLVYQKIYDKNVIDTKVIDNYQIKSSSDAGIGGEGFLNFSHLTILKNT